MSRISSTLLDLLFLLSLSASSVRAESPALGEGENVAPISEAWLPTTFGSGAPYAVLSGYFPNSCYSFSRVDVRYNVKPSVHELRTIANVRQGICLMVIVPYTHEAPLPELSHGTHTLRFVSADGTYFERTLTLP